MANVNNTSAVASGSGPALHEPPGESVASDGTIAVSGSYSDSFAQTNPGQLYVSITDSDGLLNATDASGNAVAGSGSHSIALSADYANVNAVLASLNYTASASGSDTIHFDVWNQAGTETTASVAMTVGATSPGTETWTGVVSSDWNNAGNWSGGAVPVSGDNVVIAGGTPNDASLSNAVLSGETITLQQSGSVSPTVNFTNVTLNSVLGASGLGRVEIGGTLTVGAQGTLDVGSGNSISLGGTAETIVNNGMIESAGGDLTIYNSQSNNVAAATLVNNGSLAANGGGLDFSSTAYIRGAPPQWNLLNSGSVTISNGGYLDLNGTVNGGQVTFNGAGRLDLQQPQAFAGGAVVSGFGPGDDIDLTGPAWGTIAAYSNGTLDVANNSGTETIPLTGSYSLGNFENDAVAYPNNPSDIVYAAGGSSSGLLNTEIIAPASDTIAQGGTLSLADVSIQHYSNGTVDNSGTATLTITAGSGTLVSPGQSGSGSSQITITGQTIQQIDADLQNTTYVPAAGASSDIVSFAVGGSPSSYVTVLRSVPVSVSGSGGSTGPSLNEPSSESVAANGTVAVSGSYSDSYAAGNPGSLYLRVSDASGTLQAKDAAGNAVAGSGSSTIALSTDYTDVNAILGSLQYTAPATGASDTISFDVWNQAGTETTGSVPVTIGGGGTGGTTDRWVGSVSSDWNDPANWSTGAVPVSGDTVQIASNNPHDPTLSNATLTGETIDLAGGANHPPVLTLNDVTLNSLLAGSDGGGVTIGGTLTIGAQGTLQGEGGTFVLSGTAETIVNNGLIATSAGNQMTFFNSQTANTAAATLINHGTIAANDGSIFLSSDASLPSAPPIWDVVNNGSVGVANGVLSVNGTVSGGTIALSGTSSTLQLDQPGALTNGAAVSGFGQGDRINLVGGGWGTITAFNNGTLQMAANSGTEAIPLTGSYTLGNFENSATGYPNNPSTIVYAGDGQPSGQFKTEIIQPSSATVAAGGTLGLSDVSIDSYSNGTVDNSGTVTLTVTAGSGTLYGPGGSGSGTHQFTISGQSIQQIDTDLQRASYTPAAGATSDTVSFEVSGLGGGYVNLLRDLPVSITGGSSGPVLNEPSNESAAPGGTVAVSGSYSDSLAQGNPGKLWLGISDSSGTLSSTDASGNAVAGSGSNSIGVSTDYVDLNAILSNLHYAAGSGTGSDTIHFDVWNQAGTETTAATAITVGATTMATAMNQASSTMTTDFATPASSGSSTLVPNNTQSVGSSSTMLKAIGSQPTGIPLTLHA